MAATRLAPLTWTLALALLLTPISAAALSCPKLPPKPSPLEQLRRHVCLTGHEKNPEGLQGQALYDRFYYLIAAKHYASDAAKTTTGEKKLFYSGIASHYDRQLQTMWTGRRRDFCISNLSGTGKLFAVIYPHVRRQCIDSSSSFSFGSSSSSGNKVRRISGAGTAEDMDADAFVDAVNQGRDLGPVLIDSTDGWVLIDGATTAYVDRNFVDAATSELSNQPGPARLDLDDIVAISGTLSEVQNSDALALISSASADQTSDMLALSQFVLAHPQFAAGPLPAVDPKQLQAARQRIDDLPPTLEVSAELLTSAMLESVLEDALLQPRTPTTPLSIEYDGKTHDGLILQAVDRQNKTAIFESESAKLEVSIDKIQALAPSG